MRLRQLRVRSDSCTLRRYLQFTSVLDGKTLPRFDSMDGSCFAGFDEGVTDQRTPYVGARGAIYHWQDGMSQL